jgi:hypothetical protein
LVTSKCRLPLECSCGLGVGGKLMINLYYLKEQKTDKPRFNAIVISRIGV